MVERKPGIRTDLTPDVAAVTTSSFRFVSRFISFPKRVKGLVIADIGSGASGAINELQKRGASALGFDFNYKDIDSLTQNAQGYIAEYPYIQRLWEGRNLRNFFRGVKKQNRQYVAARAEHLPLTDGSIDFAYSSFCLSVFLSSHYDAFSQAAAEAMRVLRSGGEFQIAPWVEQDAHPELWSDIQRRNAQTFQKHLDKTKTKYEIEKTSRGFLRLRITKD